MADAAMREDSAIDSPPKGYRILVIHHTHWDREWWATYQDFRIRLVELIDELLDTLDVAPNFKSFLLDSQMIVVRDYLEIRPENRDRLVRYIREGRIQCGPWYILPDEFLVSGESHIRNLLLARRAARELDIPLLQVGYIPDTFGHFGQMPQLLRGFGIDNAFMWRGWGGDPTSIKQEFLWEAPDGSTVLTHWFPDGYYQMPFLHFDNPQRPYEDKLGRIFAAVERWGPRATAGVLLMPYGGDHRPSDARLAAKIEIANEALGDLGHIEWSTLSEYVAAVREANPRLQTIRGELREFGQDNPHVLAGVLSSRLYLKRLNFWGQTWLQRYAEPLSAVAWMHGRRYDDGLLWKAWEYLIQNHPHDSICGCSIDPVHKEMLTRFAASREIAEILTEKAVQHVHSRIDTTGVAEHILVVHNPLAWTRNGWAAVWTPRTAVRPRTHQLLDDAGQDVPFDARDVDGIRPMTDRSEWTEIGFVGNEIPGLGYRTYRLVRREAALDPKQLFFTAIQPTPMLKGSERVTDLAVGQNAIENAHLRVDIHTGDGSLTVTDKGSGERYEGLNVFEDGGDAGDSYNYAAPLNDLILHSVCAARVHVSVAEATYARATLRVDLDWALPAGLTEDRLSRSSSYVPARISSFVTLTAGSKRVEIATAWENRSKDHRIRALFPLGEDVDVCCAEGQFEVTRRPTAIEDPGRGWPEPYVPTIPQQGWVSAHAGGRGLTIANRGLPEYELLPDGRGTIALTVLRSVGWLSRDDTLARVGGAGPTTPVPDAQMLGPVRAEYAIIPHAGSWITSRSYLVAEEYCVPLYGSVTDAHAGDLPLSGGTLDLLGDHTLVMSACKRGEREDVLILRCWNLALEPTEARVRLGRHPEEVRYVDLKEEPIGGEAIAVDADGTFALRAGPAGIVTVAVRFA